MDMDLSAYDVALISQILLAYTDEDDTITPEERNIIEDVVSNLKDCSNAGATLHLNLS